MEPFDLLVAAAASVPLRVRRGFRASQSRAVRRLLILGYGAIGDTIFFLPALEALRRAFPEAKLTWVANSSPVSDVLIPATGLVDEIWRWDFENDRGFERRGDFIARARESGFDAAVLTVSTPAHYFAPALAAIPLIAAHRFRGLTIKRRLILGEPSRAALGGCTSTTLGKEHAVKRNLRLLETFGIAAEANSRPKLPIGPAERARAAELVRENGSPIVGAHLGPPSSYNFRAWAPERFGELMSGLGQAWPEARFVLIGGSDEVPNSAQARAVGPADLMDFVGKTTLIESFALIERCSLFLSCDTGLSKAAMALDVPTATLWGPSSFVESGAYWNAEKHLDLATGIWCSPCSFSGMPRDKRLNYLTCGHHACLGEMKVDWVLRRILDRWPELPKKRI